MPLAQLLAQVPGEVILHRCHVTLRGYRCMHEVYANHERELYRVCCLYSAPGAPLPDRDTTIELAATLGLTVETGLPWLVTTRRGDDGHPARLVAQGMIDETASIGRN